jgi:N-acetylneuraminate synthase
MLASPIDKDLAARETAPLRDLFTKSLVARVGLRSGTVLREEHLAAKKPGTGIPAARMPEFVGARLVRDIAADEQLQESHVEA